MSGGWSYAGTIAGNLLAGRLAAARTAAGHTQEECARALVSLGAPARSQASMSRYLSGKQAMPVDAARAVSAVYQHVWLRSAPRGWRSGSRSRDGGRNGSRLRRHGATLHRRAAARPAPGRFYRRPHRTTPKRTPVVFRRLGDTHVADAHPRDGIAAAHSRQRRSDHRRPHSRRTSVGLALRQCHRGSARLPERAPQHRPPRSRRRAVPGVSCSRRRR